MLSTTTKSSVMVLAAVVLAVPKKRLALAAMLSRIMVLPLVRAKPREGGEPGKSCSSRWSSDSVMRSAWKSAGGLTDMSVKVTVLSPPSTLVMRAACLRSVIRPSS